tara:strand:- start:9912 stop:13205 length:3294 start_codon:yes stop_codon:yes gene_type:complete
LIKSERDYFVSNLYETTLMEQIELQMGKPSNALDEAQEELDDKKNDYAVAFNEYLIPRLEELSELINRNRCENRCDELVDEFLIVYSSFYSPNRYRNLIRLDANISRVLENRYGYFFDIEEEKVEANNLIPGTEYLRYIQDCLGFEISSEQFLTQEQLVQLKGCGFDLSLLDPGKSYFWKPSQTPIEESFLNYQDYFPKEGEELEFKEVKFSGKGSPKIKARFKRNGEKFNVKVKIGGREPHTENFSARLAKRLGLFQDPTEYREEIEVYFKDNDDFNKFLQNMQRKYADMADNFIKKIEDYKEGKKITIRYASLEVTPDDLHKLGGPDIFGWDHKNRREFRSIILWMGFLNLNDMKNTNWRMQLRRTPEGLRPELSMQDVGFSLGKSFTFDDVLEAAEMQFQDLRNANGFEPEFVFKREGSINVKWNDFISYDRVFETTTYFDLKWMARKIAAISLDDIAYALEVSGFAEVEQEIYLRKLASRRDGMVEVFGLEDEFPLFNLPSYAELEVPGVVESGVIVETSVDSLTPYTNTPAIVHLGAFLNRVIEVGNINTRLQLSIGSAFGGNLEYNIPFNLVENENFSVFLARPGVEVGLVREIKNSRFLEYDEGGDQKIYAIDHYTIGFTTQSGITGELSRFLPVELNAKVSHFKIKFDHYRPYSNVNQALKAPANLADILPRMKDYILNIKRNEYLTYSYETGLDLSLKVGHGQHYRVEAGQERVKSTPITFSRNRFGEFEIFQEKIQQRENYVSLSLGIDIPLFYIPILGVEYSFLNYQSQSKLYAFPFSSSQLDDAISQDYLATDISLIEDLIDGNYNNPLLESKVKYNLSAEGSRFARRSFFTFLLTGELEEVFTKTNATYQGDETNVFYRYYVSDADTFGINNGFSAHALWSRDKSSVEVQFKDEEPDDFVIILNNYNFKQQLNGAEIRNFISAQNYLYSENSDEDFFITDILPPADEVNDYKKVMSHIRVFLYADKFLENLDRLMDGELNLIIERHMARGINPFREMKARRVYNYLRTIRTILRQESFSKRRFASLLAHVVKGLNTQDYGVQILSELFGRDHMFVMGEIYGILPSFSYTQDGTSVARRRFAGRS